MEPPINPVPRRPFRPVVCGECGSSVATDDTLCGVCQEERPEDGWHPEVTIVPMLAAPAAVALPAAVGFEDRGGRGQPLRIRVGPPPDTFVMDDDAYAAEIVDVVRSGLGRSDPAEDAEPAAPGAMYANRYRIDEVLSSSPAAERFVAVQEPLVRRVVLTVLGMGGPDDVRQALEARFLREASVLSRMRHPCIAPIHETGRAPDGSCFAAQEVPYGYNLEELAAQGALSPERLVAIAADIAGALAALHDAGIPHRCLRMDQVVVGPRVWRGGSGTEVAEIGRYGLEITPEYVAENTDPAAALVWPPEVLAGQEPDESADIYALGVLLYRALSGQPPYSGTAEEIARARQAGAPPSLLEPSILEPSVLDGGGWGSPEPVRGKKASRSNTEVLTDKLRGVAMQCLAAQPERRYPSARALLGALEPLANPPPVRAPAPSLDAPPLQKWTVRIAVLAALVGAIVPTIGLVLVLSAPPETPAPAIETPALPAPEAVASAAPVLSAEPTVAAAGAGPGSAVEVAPPEPVRASPPAARAPRPAPAAAWVPAPPPRVEYAPVAVAPISPPNVVTVEPVAVPVVAAVVVAPPVVRAAPPVELPRMLGPTIKGASRLSGVWSGKAAGSAFALDITVAPDGLVSGRIRRGDGSAEASVSGRVSAGEDGLRVELQVTERGETISYSGLVRDAELRGRMYAGGRNRGRFTVTR